MSTMKAYLRKIVAGATLGAVTLSMSLGMLAPVVAQAATCVTQDAGTLIKVKGFSSVYLVSAEGKRMYFPNAEVFFSWFSDFSTVVEVEGACIDDYPAGGGINFRPGSLLVKTEVSPNVYAVGPDNMKHLIPDEATAAALYGVEWAKKVRVLADAFDANYKVGAAVSSQTPHDGMIIMKTGSDMLYYVKGGMYLEVNAADVAMLKPLANTVSAETFAKLSVSTNKIGKMDILKDPTQKGGLNVSITAPKTETSTQTETKTTTETKTETSTDTSTETKTDTTTDTSTETKTESKTVDGLKFSNANYTGPFPAPEGLVLEGTVGEDTFTSPSGSGPYKFTIQTDWKRHVACLDGSRVRLGSKGITWENGWMTGYKAGNAQFNALVPKYDATPTGSGAGSALYDEGYQKGYDAGWEDRTSVSTEYVCPARAEMSEAEILAQYDNDGWVEYADMEDASGLTIYAPGGSYGSFLNARSDQQVDGYSFGFDVTVESNMVHNAELNKALKPINLKYIDFGVSTPTAAEVAMGPEGIAQALYDAIKQKDDNTGLCVVYEPTIATKTYGSNTVTHLDMISACVVGQETVWIPRHYAIIPGSTDWLTVFFYNHQDVKNSDGSAIDETKYVNADFVTQFLTKIKFN